MEVQHLRPTIKWNCFSNLKRKSFKILEWKTAAIATTTAATATTTATTPPQELG